MSSISPVQQSLPYVQRPPVEPQRRVESYRDEARASEKLEKKEPPAPAKQSDTVQAAKAPGTGTVVDVRA